MKKAVSLLLALVIVVSLALPVSAALPNDNPVSGTSREVTKSVKTKAGREQITVEYNESASRELLRLVNAERKAEGLPPYTWNDNLTEPALTRAVEQYFSHSHTRPDGTGGLTVSKDAHGENVAGGSHPDYYRASGVMADWMTSPGHKSNILDTDFHSMAGASISTDTGTYWVQLFSANEGSETAATSTPKTTTTKTTTKTTAPKATAKADSDKTEKTVNISTILKTIDSSAKNNVAVKVQNGGTLTPANIDSINKQAKGKTVSLSADTVSGKAVVGRLTIEPAKLDGRKTDYKLGVYNSSKNIDIVKKRFNSGFSNKIAVAHIEETDLGTPTNVAIKIDLSDFNTKDLVLYAYDAQNNRYYIINEPEYKVDSNYIYFTTGMGGYIIISEGKLAK